MVLIADDGFRDSSLVGQSMYMINENLAAQCNKLTLLQGPKNVVL